MTAICANRSVKLAVKDQLNYWTVDKLNWQFCIFALRRTQQAVITAKQLELKSGTIVDSNAHDMYLSNI